MARSVARFSLKEALVRFPRGGPLGVLLAALLATELELPWAALAQQHSRRLGGGRRWVAVGRQGERLALAAIP